jgi:hypothetical protein
VLYLLSYVGLCVDKAGNRARYRNDTFCNGMLDENNGAHNRIRTGDLFLTKEVLYLLSYVGPCLIKAGNGTIAYRWALV